MNDKTKKELAQQSIDATSTTTTTTNTETVAPENQEAVDKMNSRIDNKSEREILLEYSKAMMLSIAMGEGVKSKAYYDRTGKVWTIGIGFTRKPDGSPVKPRDSIKSQEELQKYWDAHAKRELFPTLEKNFDLSKMTKEEIVAIAGFIYNCGPGVIAKKVVKNGVKKEVQTAFTKYFNKYKETGDKLYLTKAAEEMEKHNKSGGKTLTGLVKRRDFESRLLKGEIIIDEDGTQKNNPNAIQLEDVAMGAYLSIGKLPNDSTEMVNRMESVPGDTIQTKINKELKIRKTR